MASVPKDEAPNADVVCVNYDHLVSSACSSSDGISDLIERAFSSSGLGILVVTDVPNMSELRLRLLPLAQKLATLSSDQLEEVTSVESGYQVGWVSCVLCVLACFKASSLSDSLSLV